MFPVPSRICEDYYKSKCPLPMCTGRIVNIRCIITNQVIMACTECLTYFTGQSLPTIDTPCEVGRWYNNMLDVDKNSWEITYDEPTKEWDMITYFKKLNSQPHPPLSIPNNNVICPACTNLFKFRKGIDGRGHVYRTNELKENRLRILHISYTNQIIQHCRYCDSIWPAYQEPEVNNYGGTLEKYLTLLGLINYLD